MISNISHKTQLLFWNTTINVLTYSSMMRWLVKHGFKFITTGQLRQYGLMVVGSALAGLLCGYTLFLISHVIH